MNLAALYRLTALYEWDDLIFTHISARVPGPGHHFLVNPFGAMFDEITATALVKVDLDGAITCGAAQINQAGFIIHSAIHAARPDAQFVIHLHNVDSMAVAAQREGLLPLSQTSLAVLPQLAYHRYEGVALDLSERERLVADLGDKNLMLLRHHGTLAVGPTAGMAWLSAYYLERACAVQVRAFAGGRAGVETAPADACDKVSALVKEAGAHSQSYDLLWQALLRKLRRTSPGFDS